MAITAVGRVFERMFDAFKLAGMDIPYMQIEAWDTDKRGDPVSFLITDRNDSYNTWLMSTDVDGEMPTADIIAEALRTCWYQRNQAAARGDAETEAT